MPVFRSTFSGAKTLILSNHLRAGSGRNAALVKKTSPQSGAWTRGAAVAGIRLASQSALTNGPIVRRETIGKTLNNKAASA